MVLSAAVLPGHVLMIILSFCNLCCMVWGVFLCCGCCIWIVSTDLGSFLGYFFSCCDLLLSLWLNLE